MRDVGDDSSRCYVKIVQESGAQEMVSTLADFSADVGINLKNLQSNNFL